MIHIKETEIIPLLKEAQTEYSQKITEGDPKDVEMAETMTALPMDSASENREHLRTRSRPQTDTE